MNWTKENIPAMNGKVALVTGANSGIGFEISRALYQKGALVIMAARDLHNAEKAKDTILAGGGLGRLETVHLDLASLAAVGETAAQICTQYDHLDLLINNAGIMMPPANLSTDGFELQFAVNFLGHFALTGLLYPLLKRSLAARVVTLSSGAHRMAEGVNLNNTRLELPYDAFREYSVSKLANLLFMNELQRKIDLKKDMVISVGAHPGVTETSLARFMDETVYNAAVEKYGRPMPAWQGALPALYAATASGVHGHDYYGPDGKNELHGYPSAAKMSEVAENTGISAGLWRFAESVTGLIFP